MLLPLVAVNARRGNNIYKESIVIASCGNYLNL